MGEMAGLLCIGTSTVYRAIERGRQRAAESIHT